MARGRGPRDSRVGLSGVSRIHSEMIEEAGGSPNIERPLKRRRIAGLRRAAAASDLGASTGVAVGEPSASERGDEPDSPQQQTVLVDTSSSDDPSDAGSDVDWEQALAPELSLDPAKNAKAPGHDPGTITLDLDEPAETPRRQAQRRLPSSKADKQARLDVHKLHLCSLLAHGYLRNAWCNDQSVQLSLKPLLNNRLVDFLTPNSTLSQFDRTSRFNRGLEETSQVWRRAFKAVGVGIRSAQWSVERRLQGETAAFDKASFTHAAHERAGNRDVGAQLFCALLRAVGVETRLVCSMQPLSFMAGPVTPVTTPQKPTIHLPSAATEELSRQRAESDVDTDASLQSSHSGPRRIRRFGHSSEKSGQQIDLGVAPTTETPKRARTRQSPFPIFWVEAFNVARQRWTPVDPLVTQTVAKPAKFEPPASDSLNSMSYVVAFEQDGSARDVTRRYAKAYNAKTRRNRVEVTHDGSRWYKRALKVFKPPLRDRNAIEDAELLKREADEPMPRNVQDFKDHPYYALERHLRRHEIIHPRQQVGKLSVGKSAEAVEPIFRRRNVLQLKSSDKWYRLGREIKPGEQPMKLVARPRRARRSLSLESDEAEDSENMGLYAGSQTEVYVPPPVVRGLVPKNAFKNLDVYVPSMIPPGAVHIKASDGVVAARTLGVDCSEAVTGFRFKGRHGTAITQGVIVAKEYRQAMEEVVEGLRYQYEQAEAARRSTEALRVWKRMLTGLKIRERIMSERADDGGEEVGNVQDQLDDAEYEEEKELAEGGFFLDADQGPVAEPTSKPADDSSSMGMGLLSLHDASKPRNYYYEPTVPSPWDHRHAYDPDIEPDEPTRPAGSHRNDADQARLFEDAGGEGGFGREDDGGGSFVREDDGGGGFFREDDGGGGFVREDDGGEAFVRGEGQDASGHEDASNIKKASARDAESDNMNVGETEQTANDMAPEHPNRRAESEAPAQKPASHDGNDSPFDETGSLLLEDPEDEDAEPEWLADETSL